MATTEKTGDTKQVNGLSIADLVKKYGEYEKFWQDPYLRGEDDVSFVLGNQWPEKIKKEREGSNRPCLVEDHLLPFCNQVINGVRQSRPSIIPKPVDDGADIEVAEILRGVIRNIEITSDADSVYDTAARNSVMASVGWIRICTDYASYDSFDQEVKLERIQNFKSVMLDPNHQRQDGSDARDGFVTCDVDKEQFKTDYPDASTDGIKGNDWLGTDYVRVAEYFYKNYEEKTLVEYVIPPENIKRTALKDGVPEGATELRTRKTHICTIKHAKFTGTEILEENEFPGIYIPLVPVYGFETFIDGRRDFFSLVHPAKDPQMMLNYWKSASVEVVALQPKAPYVGAVGQFNSYSQQWASANTENYPFLEYDPVIVMGANGESIPMPPPMRQPPATTSQGMMQEAMACVDGIKSALGMYDASLGNQTNDISGKAIISRQLAGDNATFHFVDNLAVSIRHVGRILVDIIPIVYSGPRVMRILGEDGSEKMVPINQPVIKEGSDYKPGTGDLSQIISFDAGKYDVVVEVGASYATKRQELANAIVEIAKVNPDIMGIAGDLFIKALDVPGAEEIAKRIRSTMDPALLGDDLEAQRIQKLTEALQQLQKKLDLTEQALLAKKDNQDFQNQLDAKKVENDTTKLKIDAAKTEAEIAKINAEIGALPNEALASIAATIQNLQAHAQDVEGALHTILSAKEAEEGATGGPESPAPNKDTNYVGQPDIGSDAVSAQ